MNDGPALRSGSGPTGRRPACQPAIPKALAAALNGQLVHATAVKQAQADLETIKQSINQCRSRPGC